MRIALDARTLYRPTLRGIGKGQLDLYRCLLTQRPDWQVLAYHRNPDAPVNVLPENAVPRHVEMPGDRFDAWERWRLPAAAWRDRADLLHCPANTSPAWCPLPLVVTIHDLMPLDRPMDYDLLTVRRFEHCVVRSVHTAAAILCPSQYTACRLVADFQADPLTVHVFSQAAHAGMRRTDARTSAAVAARYGVTGPYVLHLGAAAPRKNTAGLLEAWARLTAAQRQDHTLLVIGLDDATLDRTRAYAQSLAIAPHVRLHGYADNHDMAPLFSGATCLAYPSLAEGFGLPVLDAFATRTPLLTSNTTSLPEVAGDAALLVDPHDIDAIAAGLVTLIGSDTRRRELVDAGSSRLSRFNWHQAARTLAQCFEQARHGRRTRLRTAA